MVGVYTGLIDNFPMNAEMNRSLTIKTGQTHVHRYMKPLLERISAVLRQRTLLLVAAALAAGVVLGGCSEAGAARSEAGASTETLFFDDFLGPSVDRTHWNVRVSGPIYNDEQQAYVDSPGTAHIVTGREAAGANGGALAIQARHQPGVVTSEGKRFDFVSARLDTRDRFAFAYGTAAARMKLPAGTGLWPAFWALGDGDWPATGEIDIMESVGEPAWTGVALHGPGYSGETPLVNRWYFPPGQDITGWHVYAVDWMPTGFAFRVDGRLVYHASRAMVEHYGRWAYDNPKYLILNLALGGAYPRKTNGVKSPYPGLPDSTVRRVKAGEARVLVDWVRVTRR